MLRACSLLMVVWSLVLAPALCTGGVLEHRCQPGEADCCESCAPGDDCSESTGCGHESACHTDPCSTNVRPQEDNPSVDELFAGSTHACLQLPVDGTLLISSLPVTRVPGLIDATVPQPVAQVSLPLLI